MTLPSPSPATKSAVGDRNGPGKRNPQKQSTKPKKLKPPKDTKDYRYQEVAKMVKHMIPITINGYATAKIFESEVLLRESAESSLSPAESESQSPAPEAGKPASGKKKRIRLSKKVKEDLVCKHVKKVIDRDSSQAIYLSFMMKPEDPDFPFDIETLNFNLAVPPDYGRNVKALPSMIVLNTDIPRGFSINVEKGFSYIASLARNSRLTDDKITLVGNGLLGQVQTLNKYLDMFLSQEKRETLKFVSFKSSKSASPAPEKSQKESPTKPIQPESVQPIHVSRETQSRRQAEIEEMCHKLLASVKLFNQTAAELRYKVQIPVLARKGLPKLWALSKTIDLFITIPAAYPEEKPRVAVASNFSNNLMVAKKKILEAQKESLIDVVGEYKRAETNFAANAPLVMENSESLLQLLNYLSINLGALAVDSPEFKDWYLITEELRKERK